MNELCESCIKRKTIFCPNSKECMAVDDKPYYLARFEALKEIERLNNIISELEKYLKSIQLTVLRSDNRPVYKYQEILDKLKELKEKE